MSNNIDNVHSSSIIPISLKNETLESKPSISANPEEITEKHTMTQLTDQLDHLIEHPNEKNETQLQELIATSELVLNQLVSQLPQVSGLEVTKSEEELRQQIQISDSIAAGIINGTDTLSKTASVLEMASEVIENVDLLVKLGSLFIVGKAVLNINAEIKKLEAELTAVESELSQLEEGEGASLIKKKLEEKISVIRNEIKEHQSARKTLCQTSAIQIVKATLKTAKADVELARTVSTTTTAVHQLMLVGGILGVATGAVGFGVNLAFMVQNYQELRKADAERENLIAQLSAPDLDPAIREVIQLRLKFLEESADRATSGSLQSFVGLVSSTLGVSAGTAKVLILAGVAVSAGTAGAATVVGVGAGAIAAGLLICGTGYAIYKNQEIIQGNLKKAILTVEEKWTKFSLERERKNIAVQLRDRTTEVEGAESHLRDYSQKVKRKWAEKRAEQAQIEQKHRVKINRIYVKLESLRQTQEIKPKGVAGFFRSLTGSGTQHEDIERKEAALKIKFKRLEKIARADLAKINQSLADFRARKEMKLLLKSQQLENTTKTIEELNQASTEIDRLLETQLQEIGTRKIAVNEEISAAKLSAQLADTGSADVEEIVGSLQSLLKDPDSKERVQKFMRSFGFIHEAFEENPVEGVMKFVTRTPAARA